jgi:hypothetical protein
MKRIVSVLFFVAQCTWLSAQQNIGIGTTTPNSKAILDISSTSKGILIPRMTTAERVSITTPPNGLLVYDMDKNELYHYNGTGWRAILNGEYWLRSPVSPNRFYTLDSVGIGTSAPTQRLDVSGNIRGRGDINADDNVIAGGTVQGNALVANGNLLATGTGLINGDLTTNSDLVINNSTATLQLKSGSVNKGYFQLSGDNVRMGTNSGNSTGNLIIRMNGSDRVTVNAAGDIDLDGKITRSSVTGANSLLPVCFGLINDDGTILSGSGNFTVSHSGDGVYRITCNQISTLSIGIATPLYTGFYTSALQFTANSIDVRIHRPGPILTDGAFSFLIYRAY